MAKIRTRSELFELADRFDIQRYSDGRLNKIEAFKGKAKIHESLAIWKSTGSYATKTLAEVSGLLFPEIVGDLEVSEKPWYDRNPLNVVQNTQNFYGSGAKTVRVTYTVPLKRSAYAEFLNIQLIQCTAATDVIAQLDWVGFDLNAVTFGQAARYGNHTSPLDRVYLSVGQAILLKAGDVLTGWTHINSNASLWINHSWKITEFDSST